MEQAASRDAAADLHWTCHLSLMISGDLRFIRNEPVYRSFRGTSGS
jgi:hypothetical protein